MKSSEQREVVFEHLARLENIEATTKSAISERREVDGGPLAEIDPEVFAEAEEAFYAERGKQRYVGRNGRVHWLTEQQIEDRRKRRKKKASGSSRYYYGPQVLGDKREMVRWGFIIGAVVAGLFVVWAVVL